MDQTRKLRRELSDGVAMLRGLEQSVYQTDDDMTARSLALQIRSQAVVCLDLLDQYQLSVPGRMWSYAERKCQPLREDLKRTEKLFRSASGEMEYRAGEKDMRQDVAQSAESWLAYVASCTDANDAPPFMGALERWRHANFQEVDIEAILVDDGPEPTQFDGPVLLDVFVNPSAFLVHPWMAVVCEATTGVRYTNQTGGVRCLPRTTEGYYVPVFDGQALAELRSLFEDEFETAGARGGPEELDAFIERLRGAVDLIRMDSSKGGGPSEVRLQLDDSRLVEADEAWIPVLTPDGPGVLIWENSD